MVDVDKCCMTHFPAPVLGRRAKAVGEITDDIRRLADKMVEMMVETKGVGLAGPQVGVDLSIFVASADGTRENVRVYINPEIETSGGLDTYEEGCLSLPGISAKIKRYKKCSVTAIGLDGQEFTEEAEGLLSRIFQHEYDHLQGMMIKDRMGQVGKIAARKRLKQLEQQYEDKQK